MANYSEEKTPDATSAAGTMVQRVAGILKDDILAGRIRPGERLVRQRLASRFGVSTIPVIEALYVLEVEGYVENRPLSGCRVKKLTVADIDDMLQMREALECQTARLCARLGKPEDFAKLQRKAIQVDRFMQADSPDPTLASQLHWELHTDLARLSGVKVFAEALEKVWFRRYMNLTSLQSVHFETVPADWHQQLIAEIAAGDPDNAERKMRRHVEYGKKNSEDVLKLMLDSSRAKPE